MEHNTSDFKETNKEYLDFKKIDEDKFKKLEQIISEVNSNMKKKYELIRKRFKKLREDINDIQEYTETLNTLQDEFKNQNKKIEERIKILKGTEKNFG